MSLLIRTAREDDASEMARLINEIIAIGGTTAHRQAFDEPGIISDFISPKLGICCFVAADGPQLLGFQALEWCDPEWSGEDRLPADWAVVATYVDPQTHKRGIGRALFSKTAEAAKAAGVCFVDATIQRENTGGQAFYQGMGFTDYRTGVETVSKRFAPV
ncbi:GNAT family N-acetyltransferase [Pelagibius sp. Alg239-R121]|uniref:GNAT family N-acetyltransferase n=1 Tax=Pelagibius sp. Alg239-R121 TaxID=2993448 RepID=UPI0024A68444|nr:GNAT family N-acetyltransferase [Pelagibius sp. Alg239-R121]